MGLLYQKDRAMSNDEFDPSKTPLKSQKPMQWVLQGKEREDRGKGRGKTKWK
jgi:hypothetical protein